MVVLIQGYVAFKDIESQTCKISEAPIPFPTPFIYSMVRYVFGMSALSYFHIISFHMT